MGTPIRVGAGTCARCYGLLSKLFPIEPTFLWLFKAGCNKGARLLSKTMSDQACNGNDIWGSSVGGSSNGGRRGSLSQSHRLR